MKNIQNKGTVTAVRDGIVIADGLSEVGYNDFVEIHTSENIIKGLALSLESGNTGIIVFGDASAIKAGDTILATGNQLSIDVNETVVGNVISATGKTISGKGITGKIKTIFLEKPAPKVLDRKDVSRPLQTGIIAIDSMIPVGLGQRELIIGDRQTGKTAIAIDTIINQKGKDIICIYVAIGQKASKVAQIESNLRKKGAMDYSIIVAANASDPVAMQYIAPYTGCAIAEYFAEQGKDVLVVYDDLTKHAYAYREIALLLRRPPGREAYPGDIFYLHSRLLERAAQYSDEQGGGSITALPIVETQEGDVSAYIPTNIISITDGQIYLDTDLFNAGQKPAISLGISVSRVGSAAQIKPMKKVAGKLKLQLAQYRELQAFSQFGSDLDDTTKEKLNRGRVMMELLKQNQGDPYTTEFQVLALYCANKGYLDKTSNENLHSWLKDVKKAMDGQRSIIDSDEEMDRTALKYKPKEDAIK